MMSRSSSLLDAWPSKGLVVVTNSQSCSPDGERGVFFVDSSRKEYVSDGVSRLIHQVRPQTWKEVAPFMHIKYGTRTFEESPAGGSLLSYEKRSTDVKSHTCTAVPAHEKEHCNFRGTLQNPDAFAKQSMLRSFSSCRKGCEESKSCRSFGWDSATKTCTTSSRLLAKQKIVKVCFLGSCC